MARRSGFLYPSLALLAIGAFAALRHRDFLGLPLPVQSALASPDAVTMVYVEPITKPGDRRPKFGGRAVLRTVELKGGREKQGVDWLRSLLPKQGVPEDPTCFYPRHGLRVKKGERTFDFLVCVSCGGTEVYEGAARLEKISTVAGGPLPEKTMPYLPGHPQKRF